MKKMKADGMERKMSGESPEKRRERKDKLDVRDGKEKESGGRNQRVGSYLPSRIQYLSLEGIPCWLYLLVFLLLGQVRKQRPVQGRDNGEWRDSGRIVRDNRKGELHWHTWTLLVLLYLVMEVDSRFGTSLPSPSSCLHSLIPHTLSPFSAPLIRFVLFPFEILTMDTLSVTLPVDGKEKRRKRKRKDWNIERMQESNVEM